MDSFANIFPDVFATSKAAIDLTPFYGLIGAIMVGQFGTFITVMIWVFRFGVWKGRKDTKDEQHEKDINAAHQLIRELKTNKEIT